METATTHLHHPTHLHCFATSPSVEEWVGSGWGGDGGTPELPTYRNHQSLITNLSTLLMCYCLQPVLTYASDIKESRGHKLLLNMVVS